MPKDLNTHELTMHALAVEIMQYLCERDMWEDVCIYLNGKRYSSEKPRDDYDVMTVTGCKYYVTEDIDVTSYVKYNNPDTITMTFEGALHCALNECGPDDTTEEDLQAIFNRYGLYFERGHTWSLALYPI